jgi:hypothetical protein
MASESFGSTHISAPARFTFHGSDGAPVIAESFTRNVSHQKRIDMEDAFRLIKELVITCGIIIALMCFMALCFWMYPSMNEVRKMDCAMAEFSPDMALEVKQACREARSKK